MSEIKGQLLGIILTLMVFGAISVTIAHVYVTSAGKISTYSNDLEMPAADEVGYSIPTNGALVRNDAVTFPGLSY